MQLKVANVFNMPVVVTTQYAERFGNTVEEVGLSSIPINSYLKEDKTKFSMLSDSVLHHLRENQTQTIILCGIEVRLQY